MNNRRRKCSLSIHKQLTTYQWATIRRMNLEELLKFYKDDHAIAAYPDFFSNLKFSTLENLLNSVFSDKLKHQCKDKQNCVSIISILKSGIGLIEFLIKNQGFQRNLIFGFLEAQTINQFSLQIFGDVFVNFARNCPNKLMSVIKEQKVQCLFTNNMRKPQIFKIVYTMIFCLNQKTSLQQYDLIRAVIYSLISLTFENHLGISIFDKKYWLCHSCVQDIDKNGENLCDQVSTRFSTTQNQQIPSKLGIYFSTQQLDQFTLLLSESMQQFFDNATQAIEQLSLMFEELQKNLAQVYKGNVQILVDIIIQQEYISKLFIFMNLIRNSIVTFSENKEDQKKYRKASKLFQQLESSIHALLYKIIILHQSFNNTTKKQDSSSDRLCKTSTQTRKVSSMGRIMIEKQAKICQNKIQAEVEGRIKKKLITIIREINIIMMSQWAQTRINSKIFQIRLPQASGLSVKCMKMTRMWTIKILIQIFQISFQSYHSKAKQTGIQQTSLQILGFIKQAIDTNKWNSVIHNEILKLFRMYLDNIYNKFLQDIQKDSKQFSDTLLGTIITNFRNKNHYFLNTMKTCNQGDQYFLYQIGKCISGTLSQKGDLKKIIQKYPKWNEFIHQDLRNFQSIFSKQGAFTEGIYQELELVKVKSLNDEMPIQEPLQTIQEIIENLQDNRKWRNSGNSQKPLNRRRKQSFNSCEAIKQIDSLRNFELNYQI